MSLNHSRLSHWIKQSSQVIDQWLYVFSVYALPIGIALISLFGLLAWKSQYQSINPKAISIQIAQGHAQTVSPRQGALLLNGAPLVTHMDTRLSEVPYWLTFVAPASTAAEPSAIEFPSRHAADIACWQGNTFQALGQASRETATGLLAAVKAGFALELIPSLSNQPVLCRVHSIGPARVTVQSWSQTDLYTSANEFHRNSGLLEGGIVVLAIFVLVTALINRRGLYLLFAAWLVINLRMAALSVGWDTQWLGHVVPYDLLVRVRLITMALYYVLTLTLFTSLMHEELPRINQQAVVRLAQWSCFPILLLSVAISYEQFLPMLWVVAGFGIVLLAYLLVRILMQSHSRVAVWYSSAICVTLLASLYEVIAAALGFKGLIGSVNSVTASLSSSLLAALAIAEQMRQEHEQRLHAQAELANTYEAMPIGLFTLDLHGRFVSANPALRQMLRPNGRSVIGRDWQNYFVDGAWSALHQLVHSTEQEDLEIKGKRLPGTAGTKRFLVKATLANDKIEGSLQDVTEKSRATDYLHFLANHDSLTKILNRRGAERAFNAALENLSDDNAMGFAYLDLDRFKLINDLYGHAAGDDVLKQVCGRMAELLTRHLYFGRVGGDEFVVIFPQTHIALAALTCRGIVDSLGNRSFRVGDKAFFVRGSIGLVEVSAGMNFNDVMSAADRACRQAKTSSNGGLVVYEKYAVAFQQHEAELALMETLSASSATDGLYLEMQPIMSLTAPHASLNFEVLLRMRGSDGKLIPTERLIAAGESTGRMGVIDRWVLGTTLAWLNTHAKQMTHTKFVCMNLSGASLNDEKFLKDVYTLLEQNLHIVSQLCLEITESVALQDLGNTRRFVDKVRSYGAKVALDDFGAGYTSFSYLKEFTADLLKIDGSFIVDMNKHPANVAIVEAIVNLAKNLGMKVVAEWAEDTATVQTLCDIGVDYVQGFVVALPQHPSNLLNVESSAAYVQDLELAQFLRKLGGSAVLLPHADLLTPIRSTQIQ